MAQNNDGSLFPVNADPFGVGSSSNDLFASEKPLSLPASTTQFGQTLVNTAMKQATKKPTKAELKAQAEAERARQIGLISDQINQMRMTPEWQNASLDKRNTLYDSWLNDKYRPALKDIQDAGLRGELMRLPATILKPDITNLEKAIQDSSRLGDVWEGIKTTGNQMLQGFGDYAPAAYNQARVDNLTSMLAQDGKPMVLGGVPQKDFDGNPVIQKFTADERKAVQDQIDEQMALRNQQLKEAAESDKDIAANRAAQSIGQADRNVELQEDLAKYRESLGPELGAFTGYIANAAANPSNALQMAVEQAPNIIPAVGLSAVGGVYGAAAAGSILSGQDALSTAIQQVQQLPEATLITLPEYKALRDGGMDELNAKNTLALRAGQNGALLGAIVGLATGPVGAEAGAGKLLSRVASGTVSDVAGQSTGRILAGATARGVGRTALEGVEEGGTQVAANAGQQIATGGNNSLLAGVGEATAQGLIAGAPLGGGSETISAIRDIRNRPAGTTTTEGGTQNDTTTQATEGQITDIPSAAQAAAAEQQGGTPNVSPVADQAAATEAVNALRTTFDALRSRAGQSLTDGEYSTLMEQLHNAETAGVNINAIQSGLDGLNQTRALPDGHPSESLFAAYQSYVNERTQAEAQTVAAEVANSFAAGDFINGRTDAAFPGANYTGSATRDSLNSEMATPASTNGTVTATVSENVGGINSAPETAGASGAVSNNTTTNESNPTADATLGASPTIDAANSRPDNQSVPNASEAVSVGERGEPSGAGQSATDGGSTASPSSSQTGSNVSVGDTITYAPPMRGSREITGRVVSVNPDGTFNLHVNNGATSTTYANLPVNNIKGANNAVQEQSPTSEVPRSQEPTVGLQEVGEGNAQGQEATATSQAPEVTGAATAEPSSVSEVSTERTGAVTPGGRDVQRMNTLADQLFDVKDGKYAADAAELSSALERGDMTQVDTLADYLYAEGLRQFKPANTNTGRGKVSIDTAFANDLNGAERLALQREFDMARNDLPAELSSFNAFRDAMVHDSLLVESGTAPLNSVFGRISQTARDIFTKLAKALATVVFAITLSNTFPVNDAMAAAGTSVVHNITQTQGMSPVASTVNSWVREVKDNSGQRYIIADKASGEIHIMDASGKVLATAPALYGSKTGDGMSIGETPAGIFTLQQEAAPASYGGDLQQFASAPNGDVYAIHRVLTTNPKQNRLGRLASKTAADNRVSLGCINIPIETYNKYLSSGFKGKLYIIPDQKELGSVFKGIDEIQAKQNLTEGEMAPQALNDPANTQFQSSTPTLAVADIAAPTPITGAAITEAAATMDMGTATSEMAAVSNDPVDAGMASLAVFPFIAAMRNRRKTQRDGRQGTTDLDTEPSVDNGNTPTQGLGPNKINGEDFHRITATNPDLANGNQQQRHGWLADLQARAVERLQDSEFRFVRWTGEAGLVQQGREFDSNNMVQSLKLMPNAIRARQDNLSRQYFKPISDLILRVSKDKGVDTDVVGAHMGIWTTAQHIPEANRELRKTLQNNVDTTMFGTDNAAFQNAQEQLRAFDDYQRGVGPQVEMAGGMTDAQARALIARIESYGYNIEDLQRFQQMTVQAFQGLTNERVQNGVLLQEEVDQWNAHNFQNYVALYVDKTRDTSDAFLGTSNYNPAGDYTRKGSINPANHALITLHQYLYRTAAGIESGRFKYEMHNTYNAMNAAGNTHGLQRVNMASKFIPAEVEQRAGFYYTERTTDEQGNPERRTYKYYFDDQNITDGIMKKVNEPSWGWMKGLAAVTNVHARFITKYDMSFAPINWMRDAFERASSLSSRALYDADGNKLALTPTALKLYASTFNPVNVAILAANMFSGAFPNSRVVRGLNELKQQGGLATYQHALKTSRDGMRTELRKLKGPRKSLAQLEHFFTQWNEAFGAAPAVGGYLALRDMNVPAREAAFRSLDVFNTNNRGYWTANMRAFAPFVTPAFEGGRNMMRNLSTNRGRALFAAQVALGATAYALLLGAAPDDDDKGNLLDAMKLGDLSRMMPLFNRDGSYEKMPVSFGSSRLAWILGAGMHRVSRGVDTVGSVISNLSLAALQEVQPAEFSKDVYADSFASGLLMSATPSILSPAMETLLNQNHFGGRIHGQKSTEGYASDAAMAKTPAVWSTIAQGVQSATGIDMYPESLRHLFQSYLVGPTRAINTAIEADSLYTTGGQLNTRQQLGWGWDAVGIQRFWDNGVTGTARVYYDTQDKANNIMHKYRVSASEAGTLPGQKAMGAGNRILEAGGTLEEALLVQYAVQAETDRQKMNTQMKAKAKEMKRADMDLEILSPDYEVHAQEQELLMRNFIRETQGLR